jgi:hypothetical protein
VSKVKCEKFNKAISLYLDGRLDKAGETALREHLSTCRRCAETLAALESAQSTAKATTAAEPRPAYWDTFSNRVMERIEAEKEKKVGSPLRDLAARILPAPGRRLRLAAGVASIALAVVVGVLYVDRQGGRVVPPVVQAPSEREKAPEVAKDVRTAEESPEAKVEMPSRQEPTDALKGEEAGGAQGRTQSEAPAIAAKKDGTPPAAKKEPSPSAEANERLKIVTQSVSADKQATTPQAPAKPAGEREAGETKADKTAEPPVVEIGAVERVPVEKAVESETDESRAAKKATDTEPIAAEKMDRSKMVSVTASDKAADGKSKVESYAVGGATLPKIADKDTSLTKDELSTLIASWKTLIEENRADSLTTEGYRQVATAYCLLAEKTENEAVISEGAQTIKSYLDRTANPDLREFLTVKLEEIEGLRKK